MTHSPIQTMSYVILHIQGVFQSFASCSLEDHCEIDEFDFVVISVVRFLSSLRYPNDRNHHEMIPENTNVRNGDFFNDDVAIDLFSATTQIHTSLSAFSREKAT
jgi:hypothetical protein